MGLDVNLQEKKVEIVEEAVTSNIRTLIIGSSFGHTMAQQITASGENAHLIMSSAGEGQHVTKPLLEVNDVPAIHYWVRALKDCPRVAPCNRTTHIVCNQDSVDEFENWARDPLKSSGFDGRHLINNGVDSTMPRPGAARDLLYAIENVLGYDNHLLIVDGDYIPEPDFNLNRIVEHSVVRAKDTVTYVTLAPEMGADVRDHVMLDLERNPAGRIPSNPEVMGVLPYPEATGPRINTAMGPVIFLRRTSLPLVKQFFAEVEPSLPPSVPYHHLMGHLVAFIQSKVSMYALEVKYVFSVKSLDAFLYADALFEYHAREKDRASDRLKASYTLSGESLGASLSQADARKRMIQAQFEKEAQRFGDVRAKAISAEIDMDMLLPRFNERYASSTYVIQGGERDSSLPERFSDASGFRHKPVKQHACYVTSNNVYGVKRASQQEMPLKWHGVRGDFTSGFRGAMHHNAGFVTAKTTSKVHRQLDDF